MIPLAKPSLTDKETLSVASVIRSGWVTQGPKVEEFEKKFASIVGSKHAVAVSNCTSGLHLALKALGVGNNDEVITASHSYIATSNSIRYCDAIPCFVDIQSNSFNLCPKLVESAITKRTKAILCVHQMGMPCDISSLKIISEKYDLPLVEDAACAIGSKLLYNNKWENIGKPHGEIAVFSFHPRKIITTGDGGMITTNSSNLAEKFRLWRQHSMGISDFTRHGKKSVAYEKYSEIGYNYRLTDIQAAIGTEQLKRLDEIVIKRRKLADYYSKLLKDARGITTPKEGLNNRSNWQSYCVRINEELNTKKIMQKLLDDGISSRRGIMCSHLEPAYKTEPYSWTGKHSDQPLNLFESERARNHSLILPLYYDLSFDEVQNICCSLLKIISACKFLK